MRRLAVVCMFVLACAAVAAGPESTVRRFVAAINGGHPVEAAQLVKGVDSSVLDRIEKAEPEPFPGKFLLTHVKTRINGSTATVTYMLTLKPGKSMEGVPGVPPAHTESLDLVRVGSEWLIDPPKRAPNESQILQMVSYFGVNPDAKDPADECREHIGSIAVGFFEYLLANDAAIQVTQENWRSQLLPYVEGPGDFTCPEDPEGTISYSFNGNLTGTNLYDIMQGRSDADQIVVAYEGKSGKLNFRHAGKAAVATLMGGYKMVDKDEARKLIWKP